MRDRGPGVDDAAQETIDRASPRGSRLDLAALAVPPAVWFVHLNLSYVLVPPSCRAGHRWYFLGVTVVALVTIVPAARRSLAARRHRDPRDLEPFLGTFGVWFAALFALATLVVGLSAVMVAPC